MEVFELLPMGERLQMEPTPASIQANSIDILWAEAIPIFSLASNGIPEIKCRLSA